MARVRIIGLVLQLIVNVENYLLLSWSVNLFIILVLSYPLLLIGVGIWRSRSIKSHADFMVAGRSLPVVYLVGSLVCTWVGAGTLFGGAGLAWIVQASQHCGSQSVRGLDSWRLLQYASCQKPDTVHRPFDGALCLFRCRCDTNS